jgi:hypothetical protein
MEAENKQRICTADIIDAMKRYEQDDKSLAQSGEVDWAPRKQLEFFATYSLDHFFHDIPVWMLARWKLTSGAGGGRERVRCNTNVF